jgi:hypothetical protein
MLGAETASTVNDMGLLKGPVPAVFLVCIHHFPGPVAKAVAGVTEQIPTPEAQPASEELYHFRILFPVESFTLRSYSAARATAFQV